MHAQRSGFAARAGGRLTVVILLPLVIIMGCKQSPATEPDTGPDEDALAGGLDVVTGEQIGGWAWDSTQPNTPIKVEIFDGDKKVETVLADQPREDLMKDYGNGKHSFNIATPDSLKDGKSHTIRAKVQGTDHELEGSPKTLKVP
jgi:hypothetical protein